MNDFVLKEDLFGKRSFRNKSAKKFQPNKFDDLEQNKRMSEKRGRPNFLSPNDTILLDDEDSYADLIDIKKIK